MIAELLAISTALFYGLSAVFVKKGMRGSNPVSATFVSIVVNFVFCCLFLIFSFPSSFDSFALSHFILAGMLAGVIGRTLNYLSIEKVGVSITQAVLGSNSLFAVILAIFFLAEKFSPIVYLGVAFIVMGIAFLTYKGSSGDEKTGKWKNLSLLYPIFAACSYGGSNVLKKIGLNILDSPLLASAAGSTAALGLYLIILVTSGKFKTISLNKYSLLQFSISGLFTSLAFLFTASALSMGRGVTTVAPLISSSPLFAILLSYLFLRDAERITPKIVLGAVSIVLGVVLITIF